MDVSGENPKEVIIDERWIPEWRDKGIEDCLAYLKKHADFEAYLERMEKDDGTG